MGMRGGKGPSPWAQEVEGALPKATPKGRQEGSGDRF